VSPTVEAVVLPAPFGWTSGHIELELPGARVLFTTRRGGVSDGPFASLNLGAGTGDEPGRVVENRARAARLAGDGSPASLLAGRQVHGARVARHRADAPDDDAVPVAADGRATDRDSAAATVLAADCLPIALAAPGAVAMVHAGWRGLAGGVVAQGVAALRALGSTGPIAAAIGPGARPCCYEVGDDVRAAFARHRAGVRRGRAIDLAGVARLELEAAGVGDVHDVGLCTICSDPALFFSHRRDRGTTGRQAGLVVRA